MTEVLNHGYGSGPDLCQADHANWPESARARCHPKIFGAPFQCRSQNKSVQGQMCDVCCEHCSRRRRPRAARSRSSCDEGERQRERPVSPSSTFMSAVFSSKATLPLLAFISTSLLLFFAYSGTEHPYKGRYRYPNIAPPGASDSDRLRYSESPN